VATETLRFLHSADLHLEVPVQGLVAAPPALVERVSALPLRLLRRLGEVAVKEEVHFVLLVGNVMDWQLAGPRVCEEWIVFCETLAKHGIPVIWAASSEEAMHPVPPVLLPEGSVWLSGERPQTLRRTLQDGTQIVFVRWPEIMAPSDLEATVSLGAEADYVIAVRHQSKQNNLPMLLPLDYWALGGMHLKKTDTAGSVTMHDPGAPVARSVEEASASSFTLATLRRGGGCDLQFQSTGLLRWETVPLLLTDACSEAEFLAQSLQEWESRRQSELGEHFIRFEVCGDPVRMIAWRRAGVLDRALMELRSRCEREQCGPWPLVMELEPWEEWPGEWLKEDSFRGELLRQSLGQAGAVWDELASELHGLPEDWRAELEGALANEDREKQGSFAAISLLELLRAAEDES